MITHLKYLLFFLFYCTSLQSKNYSYHDLIKECRSEQIEAIKEASSFLGLDEKTQFKSLEGGLTQARVYSFEIEEKKLILRFLALTPNHTKEMRKNEIQALKIGCNLGIAPNCIFSDQNPVLMVMPFVEGHPLHKPEDHQLKKLGKMIRSLHSYSDSYPTRYTFKQRLEIHYQKGIKLGIAYPKGFNKEILAVLSAPSTRSPVPCHGDLNPSNILVDDSLKNISLIDWTTATLDDPFADLSFFCLLSNLSPEQEKIFLESYFGRTSSEKEHETLKEEKAKICLLTATLWFRFSETEEEKALPLASRISALDTELSSPTLKSIDYYLKDGVVVDLNTAPKSAIKSYALSFYKAYLKGKEKG